MLSEFKTPKTGLWLMYSKMEPICDFGNLKLLQSLVRKLQEKRRKKIKEYHTAAMAVIADASK